MGDEKIYQRVIDELDGKPRKYTDKALWTKAEVLSKGDDEKTRYKYIELRVAKLKEQEEIKAEKAIQKEREKKEKEENHLKEIQLKDEQKKLEKTDSTIFWVIFFIAFIAGRLFGLIGLASVFLGYFSYKYASKEYSLLISILSGVAVTVISYYVGLLVFVIGLETLL